MEPKAKPNLAQRLLLPFILVTGTVLAWVGLRPTDISRTATAPNPEGTAAAGDENRIVRQQTEHQKFGNSKNEDSAAESTRTPLDDALDRAGYVLISYSDVTAFQRHGLTTKTLDKNIATTAFTIDIHGLHPAIEGIVPGDTVIVRVPLSTHEISVINSIRDSANIIHPPIDMDEKFGIMHTYLGPINALTGSINTRNFAQMSPEKLEETLRIPRAEEMWSAIDTFSFRSLGHQRKVRITENRIEQVKQEFLEGFGPELLEHLQNLRERNHGTFSPSTAEINEYITALDRETSRIELQHTTIPALTYSDKTYLEFPVVVAGEVILAIQQGLRLHDSVFMAAHTLMGPDGLITRLADATDNYLATMANVGSAEAERKQLQSLAEGLQRLLEAIPAAPIVKPDAYRLRFDIANGRLKVSTPNKPGPAAAGVEAAEQLEASKSR